MTILDGTATIELYDDGDPEIDILESGELSLEIEIDGKCYPPEDIVMDGEAGLYMAVCDENYPEYTGPFTVIPKIATAQILETAQKTVLQDIEVTKIPVHTTTNPAGGNTVFIGGDISYG